MNDLESLQSLLKTGGESFPYPPTPDLLSAGLFRDRRLEAKTVLTRSPWAIAAAILIVLVLGGLAVPQVRAAVINWLQVGAVRIFFDPDVKPVEDPTPLPSFNQLSGRTTLAEAERLAGFAVPLPYGMRPPEHIFFQELGGPVVFCIWNDDEAIELSLMILGKGAHVGKSAPTSLNESRVDGVVATWLTGDHFLYLRASNGLQNFSLPVDTNVLLWQENGLTFRLAGEIDFDRAVELMRQIRQ